MGRIEEAGDLIRCYGRKDESVGMVKAFGTIDILVNNAGMQQDAPFTEMTLKLIPYNRVGEPSDIGKVAVWLASDESDYIHGAYIFVDGGMTFFPGFASGG